MENRFMKYSIKRQFAGIFGLLMVGTILFCWFINNTFLERYYMKDKQKALLETYQVLNRASNEDKIGTDEFDIEFQKICGRYNVSFILLDAKSKTLKTSTPDYSTLSRRLLNNLFEQNYEDNDRLLQKGEKYEIQIATDDRINTDFLEMWGVLDNGNLFLLRCPLESIRESVNLANRFLAYVGFGAAIVSAVIVLIISGKITKPIKELTEISERMIHLDFEAKYTGKSKTEIALLGQNINELSCTLEQTISELKSANNELQRDIEKKNKIDEMRKEFLSNVSHELKTPIALIQGYAEGLKEGISDDPESIQFYCDVICDETNKMNEMVKKLLSLNQLEFDNKLIEMKRFDITELVRGKIMSYELIARQKELHFEFEEESCQVWGDEFWIEEVIGNYISNAINYAEGEKIIRIRYEKNENTLRLHVFNTGKEIPSEDIAFIWDKFYKVDKARSREYGGNGIGLSIVKAIMERHRQEYGVENCGNGVDFWFELELVEKARKS